jgi:hypothetical protein
MRKSRLILSHISLSHHSHRDYQTLVVTDYGRSLRTDSSEATSLIVNLTYHTLMLCSLPVLVVVVVVVGAVEVGGAPGGVGVLGAAAVVELGGVGGVAVAELVVPSIF